MCRKISLIVFCVLLLNGQENRIFWDGREWNKIRKNANYDNSIEHKIKSTYINGVLDGRLYGYLRTWSKNATLANEVFGESVDYLSVREIINNLNYFYEDPLNSYIPIPTAIIIANLYGQRVPIDIIEKYTQDSRDWVNTLVLELDTLDYSRLIEEKYLKNNKTD
ncbi:MAG: hypothetical protein CMI96_01325 [Pelagibacteraceae bacterium]|nr:hypothetical protein [Pelagibacteraceae bacterium]|tara:strand:+ start:24723 stop:25217 length:495 start_codon:yes stop_codon:yes gene_type:complete